MISIIFKVDGIFCLENYVLCYLNKQEYGVTDIDPDRLSRIELVEILGEKSIKGVKELWFCKQHCSLNEGLQEIVCDRDILDLCATVGEKGQIDVYVVRGKQQSPRALILGQSKVLDNAKASSSLACSRPEKKGQKTPQNPRKKAPKESLKTPVEEQSDASSEGGEQVGGSDSSDLGEDKLPDPFDDSSEDDDPVKDDGRKGEIQICDESIAQTSKAQDQSNLVNLETSKSEEDQLKEDGRKAELEDDAFNIRVDDSYGGQETCDESTGQTRYPQFNPLVDFNAKLKLCSGMKFGSNTIFRKAVRQFAIENGFDYYYLHNDAKRVSIYCSNKCDCPLKGGRKQCITWCSKNLCGFRAKGRKMHSDGTFQMKTFVPNHDCGWQHDNRKVTSKWLAEKYVEHYRDDSQWRIKSFISTVRRDYNVHISYHKAWRARVMAILETQGYAPKQYGKVYDYAAEVMKRNPGSSLYVRPEQGPEKPIFQRFYVCLAACKRGFLAGIRPVVGIDGCHLKGAYSGQVFTAVAMDDNFHIFPIAYAVVEAERKETWVWFLEILMQDIGGKPLTFMSDRQKGLMEAISIVAPQADTRVCVRHLHNNFKVKWCGRTYKDAVWAAARSATRPQFEANMALIKDMDPAAEAWLRRSNPETWSLHGFKHYAKSEMLLNNACESFNSCILEARELPILSMCEWIRRKLMKFFINKRKKMGAYQGVLTPEVATIVNDRKIASVGSCNCLGEGMLYEVDCKGKTYVVDLQARTCGCNMWAITGIPCVHAISCMLKNRLDVNAFVDPYYYKDTFMRVYALSVNPMPGEDQWEKTDFPPLLPPKLVVQPGRPKKSRLKDKGEKDDGNKLKRNRQGKNKCSNCHEEGHTKKSCKNTSRPPPPKPAPRKRGRPPSAVKLTLKKRKYTRKVRRTFENAEAMPSGPQVPTPVQDEAVPIASEGLDEISDADLLAHVVEMEDNNEAVTQASQVHENPSQSSMVVPYSAPSQSQASASMPARRFTRSRVNK